MGKLQTAVKTILPILQYEPRTRDSDECLIFRVWQEEARAFGCLNDGKIILTEYLIQELTNPETIIRSRAIIQNEMRKYPPSPDTARGRAWLKKQTEQELREFKETLF